MNFERLRLMSALLGEIAADPKSRDTAFNLGSWVSPNAMEDDNLWSSIENQLDDEAVVESGEVGEPITYDAVLDILEKSSGKDLPEDFCGTSACAVGHACLDPRFNALGLTLYWPELRRSMAMPVPDFIDGPFGYRDWAAVKAFFDLSEHQAHYLFLDDRYEAGVRTTAKMVQERVDQFLADNADLEGTEQPEH